MLGKNNAFLGGYSSDLQERPRREQQRDTNPPLRILFASCLSPTQRINNHPRGYRANRRRETENNQVASGRSLRQPLLQQHGGQAERGGGLVDHDGEEDDEAQARVGRGGRGAERDAVCGCVDDEPCRR